MDAATKRTTVTGNPLNDAECISPEAALRGFLGELDCPTAIRTIRPGAPADCCLLDVPWQVLRGDLSCGHVSTTILDGELVYFRA
jgi:predicted amidohydrolase YtcJ